MTPADLATLAAAVKERHQLAPERAGWEFWHGKCLACVRSWPCDAVALANLAEPLAALWAAAEEWDRFQETPQGPDNSAEMLVWAETEARLWRNVRAALRALEAAS